MQLFATGALVILPAAPAAPAAAATVHAELKTISPAHNSVQTSMPAAVELTFNQPVNRRYTVIKVTAPGGSSVGSGDPDVAGAEVRQPLRPLPEPGRYRVAYRTLSVDGHVISGTRAFTFAPTASPTASATTAGSGGDPAAPQAPAAAGQSSEPTSGGAPWGLLAFGGVAAVLAAAVVAAYRGRRARGADDDG